MKSVHREKPSIFIQNIVASAALNQRISLKTIVEKFPQAEYSPRVFPGLVFRLKRPKTATLIFETGRWFAPGRNRRRRRCRR